jgi:hypothetical protein
MRQAGASSLTPPQIDARLNREIIAALAAQDVAARFAELGITTPAMTPDDLRDFVAAETARWGTVARRAISGQSDPASFTASCVYTWANRGIDRPQGTPNGLRTARCTSRVIVPSRAGSVRRGSLHPLQHVVASRDSRFAAIPPEAITL